MLVAETVVLKAVMRAAMKVEKRVVLKVASLVLLQDFEKVARRAEKWVVQMAG